jgi:hypothetical protein
MVSQMSQDAVLMIRETEKKADEIRRQAAEKALMISANAKSAGEKRCAETEKDTRAELKVMLSEMKTKAASLIERSRSEAKEEAAMAASAEPKMGMAAKLIIRRLMEKCQ